MLRRDSIRAFLDALPDHLDGEWILLGGALVALLLDGDRGTEDIDLVPRHDTTGARLRLLSAGDALGLGVEAVNSAAAFFLMRLDGWQDDLLLLRQQEDLTIWRPGPRLFVRTKLGRMSERDLADCLLMLDAEGAGLDWSRVRQEAEALQEHTDQPATHARRARLLAALGM